MYKSDAAQGALRQMPLGLSVLSRADLYISSKFWSYNTQFQCHRL